ncbi:hypothetical protein K435DRAFT_868411 [Dendrothele bispora CBS 962.96]|uniref:P-loop containing nucleoside triphosphate hydrolase protein n=1 Tax=Dendrothele bispora (strain CBS 962.96) TaxID=1314807 RepID=A0A4S8LD88_DENBC|nr:hypothetical protein K435DRAFT_868411 [Dendrothele bispora CBS 962.96]
MSSDNSSISSFISSPASFDINSNMSDSVATAAATPATPATPATNAEAVGLANAQLSDGRRRMLDLVNRLHMTGVQIDIDLPQIAVIGNQSAGKSSLIESISGITLPRAAGTCTRCPTECSMSANPTWKCTVSLRIMTDSTGQLLGEPRNEQFGPVIYEKSQVEDRIRRAQRALLHPNVPRSKFLEENEEDIIDDPSAPTFSSNCVSLKISGPNIVDLSFCDLPGLIRSSSGEGSAGDVELVEKLVESYIKKPSCIILLAVSCETDFQNQGALQMAKKFDPNGERTVGVLTKPDRISVGDESLWVRFIRNDVPGYILSNSWYCVKQPNSVQLREGITWKQARAKEHEFFSMTSPWADLEPMFQRYLRTSNFVERLSRILSDLISKRLPEIHKELENSIRTTQGQLQKLPKAPSGYPLSEITTLIVRFTSDLCRHLEGVPEKGGLPQEIRPAQVTFRKAIRGTAPNFKPFDKLDARTRTLARPDFLDNEDEADDDIGEEVDVGEDDSEDEPDAIYIDEVLRQAQESRTRELPGNYPYIVQEGYIRQITDQWLEPAKALCDRVHVSVSEYVLRMVQRHFKDFGMGLLERQVRVIMQEHLKNRLEATQSRIDWLFELELRPFTLNTHYMADYREKFMAHYKGARHEHSNTMLMQQINSYSPPTDPSSQDQNPVSKVLSGLVQVGMFGVKATDLPRLLSDPMEPALDIMADVRAYFQVAYKRFADNIPLAIDHELVRGLEKDILDILTSQLRIYSEADGLQICKELAEENPRIAGRREELTKKLERIQAASRELSRF